MLIQWHPAIPPDVRAMAEVSDGSVVAVCGWAGGRGAFPVVALNELARAAAVVFGDVDRQGDFPARNVSPISVPYRVPA
jgi:hypothetical protein